MKMAEKKKFAVFGLGRFGKNIALTLTEMGHDVLGVDKDENISESLAEKLAQVVSFDIRDPRALEQVGISNFDTVVIASANLESSLMAVMLCKEKNISEIVVKAIDERHAEMAKKLGADKIIFSERDMARQVAFNLATPHAVNAVNIDADIHILSLEVPPKIIGKNLIQANLRADYGINIVAIVRNNESVVTPPPDFTFTKGDKIFLVGEPASLANFENDMDI